MQITFAPTIPEDIDVALVSLVPGQEQSFVQIKDAGQKVLSIGIKEPDKINRRKFILLARQVIALARTHRVSKIAFEFSDFTFPKLRMTDEDKAEVIATNITMANFEFIKYKTEPKEGWSFVEEVTVVTNKAAKIKKAFEKGHIIGKEVNASRALATNPGGEMTPEILAAEAKKAVEGLNVKVEILGEKEMKKLGMGGVLGVGQGSDAESQFIILEYMNGKKSEKPLVLVGKGVTFDTGGLNVKPGDFMYEMHMDMSGGAAVIHTVAAAAKLKLKKNVVALVPAVENMPSGSSYHPGDVLRSMSGKTIEVINTDAEGRVILSDALTYAEKYNPRLVADVATLTGAAVVALGTRASAIFTRDEKLETLLRKLGEESGDYVWPLPMWEEYEEEIKGTFGDVANTGKTRYGGAIDGATFLQQFAQNLTSWVHIDIAPRMTTIEGEFLAKGSAGAPVRLLLRLLETY